MPTRQGVVSSVTGLPAIVFGRWCFLHNLSSVVSIGPSEFRSSDRWERPNAMLQIVFALHLVPPISVLIGHRPTIYASAFSCFPFQGSPRRFLMPTRFVPIIRDYGSLLDPQVLNLHLPKLGPPVASLTQDTMEGPTLTGHRVRSGWDARLIFHAVAQQQLPLIVRRLTNEERRAYIRPGSVFVWEERGPTSQATGVSFSRASTTRC